MSLDFQKLRALPLRERNSLTSVEEILISPDAPVPASSAVVTEAAARIRAARGRGAAVILIYGAHLLRNGAARLVTELMERGWITHLATNGAGSIHDWEYAWLGRSTENVEDNVAAGTFGTWDETGRCLHLALLAGGLHGEGYGAAVGRFICEDGTTFSTESQLRRALGEGGNFAPAIADLLRAMELHRLAAGRHVFEHRWKEASILAQAWRLGVPATVHPGIGYDIIACHPMFNGAAIGRAAELDFKRFAGAVDQLDGGVVLSIGSAIMGPQIFEKALSCAHNLRFQNGRGPVRDHAIYVVDLQDGGGWDWSAGEPPKEHPAYYLRFCKSYSRMGGEMRYVQSDNVAFVHRLLHELRAVS